MHVMQRIWSDSPIVVYKTQRGRIHVFIGVKSIGYEYDNNGHVLEVLHYRDGAEKVLRADYYLRQIPKRERRRRTCSPGAGKHPQQNEGRRGRR